ncbi:pyrroloquinoline quinone biosynthesis peptide chaperone PqqD [Paraburkholderia phosphatilytica]|uniref:pyrroloquinoline quinone biosynthesis peptide chaperone PqqD n=1 Tax=Paraburkholderia phosphatilytica TaxID=2282883 RepID=UPI000E481E3E|nr:pyrroloquinoline quinone biosynthesis peptide chaperone PqqD [Paraburkholderia phosphatilytica]
MTNADAARPCVNPRPILRSRFILRWENMQDTYVLAWPEGTVRLNPSAGEILARCDGTRDLDGIIEELEALFSASDLATDIYRFIDYARQRGWLD